MLKVHSFTSTSVQDTGIQSTRKESEILVSSSKEQAGWHSKLCVLFLLRTGNFFAPEHLRVRTFWGFWQNDTVKKKKSWLFLDRSFLSFSFLMIQYSPFEFLCTTLAGLRHEWILFSFLPSETSFFTGNYFPEESNIWGRAVGFPKRYFKVFRSLEKRTELQLLWKCQTWWCLVTTISLNSQQTLNRVITDSSRKWNAGCHSTSSKCASILFRF